MTKRRKSKYNLENPAFAKIPREMARELEAIDENKEWSENLRDMISKALLGVKISSNEQMKCPNCGSSISLDDVTELSEESVTVTCSECDEFWSYTRSED